MRGIDSLYADLQEDVCKGNSAGLKEDVCKGMSRNIRSGAIFGPGRTKNLQFSVPLCHIDYPTRRKYRYV